METTLTFSSAQILTGLICLGVLLAGLFYGGFYWGWQRGFARGWTTGEEWSARALLEVGAVMRPPDAES